jgi:GalNAc-alpha-(1->4)-GalNAc-alpha-(1->3)-diNAcBac-PP-undecaprenol alpha-1,4-N-acetyl-D-galactosaminyltransferase
LKKLCFVYQHDFHTNFLEKDVGLLPIHLSNKFNVKTDFLYFNDYYSLEETNNLNTKEDNKIQYISFNRLFKKFFKNKKNKIIEIIKQLNMILFSFKHAKEYDFLFMFHLSFSTWVYVYLMKKVNKNIKVFLKLDIDENYSYIVSNNKHGFIKKLILGSLVENCDLISCETISCYNILKNGIYGINTEGKLTYLPNGIDSDILNLYSKEEIYDMKENIIITVGRIGTYEKNSQLLLDALVNVDLKDWKVYFIGPISKGFEENIATFQSKHPYLKEKIIFTGPIFNRPELFKYFAKSKCFILTSRFESYGLVLNEAFSYYNYIISTNVGAAEDIVVNDKLGKKINSGDVKGLKRAADYMIQNNERIISDLFSETDRSKLTWNNIIEKNIQLNQFFKGNS